LENIKIIFGFFFGDHYNCIENLKKYQKFYQDSDFSKSYWKHVNTSNLSFIHIDNFIDFLQSLKEEYIKLNEKFNFFPFQEIQSILIKRGPYLYSYQ